MGRAFLSILIAAAMVVSAVLPMLAAARPGSACRPAATVAACCALSAGLESGEPACACGVCDCGVRDGSETPPEPLDRAASPARTFVGVMPRGLTVEMAAPSDAGAVWSARGSGSIGRRAPVLAVLCVRQT